MSVVHQCQIHCFNMEEDQEESLGIKDFGKWLPFAFHMDIVTAIKLTTDDSEQLAYNCTTIFTENGDSYIIDTPYVTFNRLWLSHVSGSQSPSAQNNNDLPNF